jgi:hypothetical protein
MLDAANQHFKDALARYTLPELAEDKRKEIRKIVQKARQALMT